MYSEQDLPVTLKETEVVTLDDGTTIRYEESGGARDVMINEEFTPRVQLFPCSDYILETGGKRYKLLAGDFDLSVALA